MATSEAEHSAANAGEVTIRLRSLQGAKSEYHVLHLDDGLLSLRSEEGRLILMLPREDAARHIRFDWDLPGGRVISFVVEGLRAYRFRCDHKDQDTLVRWLPQKPREELAQEIRQYGVALILLGAIQLYFQAWFFSGWGAGCVALGVGCVLWPKRAMYAINAAAMLVMGLCVLYMYRPMALTPGSVLDWHSPLSAGLGSLLVIGSVQQISLLGVNNQLRAARSQAGVSFSDTMGRSPMIRKMAFATSALSVVFWGQAAAGIYQGTLQEATLQRRDWLSCVVIAVLVTGIAAVLWLRRRPAYLEAKVSGWLCVTLVVLYGAGMYSIWMQSRLPYSADVFWSGAYMLGAPYVWGPLLALLVLFSRWFNKAVEKELHQLSE